VTVAVAIAGLAFLILIHEAGHFFTALAVGMRPRRFYIGFPPALVKRVRNGVEYGIGMIPLGGYVKIPGMHRPAPSDLDLYFGSALYEEPRLLPAVDRVKRPLAEDSAGRALPRAADAVLEAAERADAVAIGPGLGRSDGTVELVRILLERLELPVVLDADALWELEPFARAAPAQSTAP